MPGKQGKVLTTCGVIGKPITHSLSPALHHAAYRELGLDWQFRSTEVEARQVAEFVSSRDESWRGIAATMPCKEALVGCGEPDDLVRLVGGANTLVYSPSGPIVRNTDVSGMVDALRRADVTSVEEATILGNGATARSALAAMSELGARSVVVLARRPERATSLVNLGDSLGVHVRVADLTAGRARGILISTIPAGGVADRAVEFAHDAECIFDVIYDPWPTPLVAAAPSGTVVLGGLDLLAAQARRQVQLFTGHDVAITTLLAAGQDELRRRARQMRD